MGMAGGFGGTEQGENLATSTRALPVPGPIYPAHTELLTARGELADWQEVQYSAAMNRALVTPKSKEQSVTREARWGNCQGGTHNNGLSQRWDIKLALAC